jgi:hypothetical protein
MWRSEVPNSGQCRRGDQSRADTTDVWTRASFTRFDVGPPDEPFPVNELAKFAVEEQNSGNWRGVIRLVVELQAEGLKQGVVFVDTPGLGSLAISGAAETTAYFAELRSQSCADQCRLDPCA